MSRHTRKRLPDRPGFWAALGVVLATTIPVLGTAAPPETAKTSPALLALAAGAPDDTISAWIELADKGEQGPADLARRLAEAEAALSPRARARRVRAHVHPLVDYADLPVHSGYLDDLVARGMRPYGVSRWLNAVAVRSSGRAALELARLPHVARLGLVPTAWRSVEPAAQPRPLAPLGRAAAVGAVDYGSTLSQLTQINLPAIHDSGYTGAGILICVLDEGFNFFDKHEALRDHVIPPERQRDFHRGLQTVQDTLDPGMVHGTWVLGVLAGRKFGTYVGAAFDAEYALARTEVRQFERTQEMIYWGMGAEWADSLGADVINSSLGYFAFDSSAYDYAYADLDGKTTVVSRAAQVAVSKGILVVNSVGNEGANAWHYLSAPSDVNGDSLIAVGAVDQNGLPASFSSYGPSADGRVKPDLAARGVSNPIVSTSGNPNAYGALSGSSFSAPLVAGLAACVLQARPQWTPRDVVLALRFSGSRSANPDSRVGYGIPDARLALDYQPLSVPPGGSRVSLRLVGANPVAFGRAQARVAFAWSAELCGQPGALRVFDAQGRRVRELWSGVVSCGLALPVTVTWDGRDDGGREVAPGLYVVDLRAGSERTSLRVVALR